MKRILHLGFYSILTIASLSSCDNLETRKISSKQYLDQEWEALDINEVDGYPTFDTCNNVVEGPALQSCFENTITETFYENLGLHHIVVSKPINKTIYIGFIVNEKGSYYIEELNLPEEIKTEIPELESWIYEATQSLPKAKPATKMGIPVKTRFKIPLVLEVE